MLHDGRYSSALPTSHKIFVDMQMPDIRGNESMPLVAMTARTQMPTIGLGRASS